MSDKLRAVLADFQSWRAQKEAERAKEDAEWLWTSLYEALRR